MNLEDVYARLTMEEEGGVIIGEDDVGQSKEVFVLIGRFLTDRNINFSAMQNVLASLWRPREGVEIRDIGGQRYSFVFYHKLDLQKVVEGGPWTFEQSTLVYRPLKTGEEPQSLQLNTMDIWVQIYDLPHGMVTEKVLQSIGNYIGEFNKTDPNNVTGGWKMYLRIRVTMDVRKPLKRRMKIKREGGDWGWINFKYERLATFCFVCGLLGHSDRECGVVYANPDKVIDRAYGTWLRAPLRNARNQNIGARWLRNGGEGGQAWSPVGGATSSTVVQGGQQITARFMEIDGKMTEILGGEGAVCYVQRDHRDKQLGGTLLGGDKFEDTTVVMDTKRKRRDNVTDFEGEETESRNVGLDDSASDFDYHGPKNLREAGPVVQARLLQ